MALKEFTLVLPVAIVGQVDLGRVQREIGRIHTTLQAQALRSPGATAELPKLSQLLDDFVQTNKLNLREVSDRSNAVEFLEDIKNSSPRVHMSFSADPSVQFMSRITTWFRQNIHPTVLITVGLQPGIGAGCVVRTPNKYFDLSLGKSLADNRELLIRRLREPEVVS